MKYLLFIFLIALITCQAIEDNLFERVPAHPLKRFYDNLRKEGIYQKIQNEFVDKGKSEAIKLCTELVPEIPEFITRYFSTNKEFCSKYIEALI